MIIISYQKLYNDLCEERNRLIVNSIDKSMNISIICKDTESEDSIIGSMFHYDDVIEGDLSFLHDDKEEIKRK